MWYILQLELWPYCVPVHVSVLSVLVTVIIIIKYTASASVLVSVLSEHCQWTVRQASY